MVQKECKSCRINENYQIFAQNYENLASELQIKIKIKIKIEIKINGLDQDQDQDLVGFDLSI